MVEQKVYIATLFDLYGAMLTNKQINCLRLHLDEDFSLAEIGSELGISRQAVHDNIVRAEQTLVNIELKLGLYAKNNNFRYELKSIHKMLLDNLTKNDEVIAKNALDKLERIINMG